MDGVEQADVAAAGRFGDLMTLVGEPDRDCMSCRWCFHGISTDAELYSECRLMPPSVELEAIDEDGEEIVIMGFPPVASGVWCSHWEPVA